MGLKWRNGKKARPNEAWTVSYFGQIRRRTHPAQQTAHKNRREMLPANRAVLFRTSGVEALQGSADVMKFAKGH
jgi:hypothetical protein